MTSINVYAHTVRILGNASRIVEEGGDLYHETQSSSVHPEDREHGRVQLAVLSEQLVAAERALALLESLDLDAFGRALSFDWDH